MTFKIVPATNADVAELASLRVAAMRESLEAVGRFDPMLASSRFTEKYDPALTHKIFMGDELAGFYTCWDENDHVWVNHFYIEPKYQGAGLGSKVLSMIIEAAEGKSKPIRLMALKRSRANKFYLSNGFVRFKETEWDNFYERAM